MQIKLGEKIRELRRRDGRTQESLADALGVSSQAVSRWEANGGYPDMETIPAIANFFHITIDELFGYNTDRDQKIKKILADADSMINAQSNIESCVELLREAASEFPAEPQIWLRLGYALTMYGFQKPGARRYIKEGEDCPINDIEYNSKNEFFKEALQIFQKALSMGIGPDDRRIVIPLMVRAYALIGAYDEAQKIAKKQDFINISRECLLPDTTEGERRDMYQGEALLELIKQLKKAMDNAVMTKRHMTQNEIGVDKLLGIAHLYELILDDGNCGEYHFDLLDTYRWCAVYTAKQGDIAKALDYFETAFQHAKKYEVIRNIDIFHYTAPLISKVTTLRDKWPKAPVDLWKSWLKNVAPSNLIEAIQKDDRYTEVFAG